MAPSSVRRSFLVLSMVSLLLRPSDGQGGGSTLKVLHKKHPNWLGMLLRDDTRVRQLQSNNITRSAVSIPTSSGISVGSGNYLVPVGLGTPEKKLQLVMDTGSEVTWTQCSPCTTSCYNQTDPIFDPSKSFTYANVSCSSSICTTIFSDPSNPPSCTGQTCDYSITYGDNSSSTGWVAMETLTLTPSARIPNYMFGCGQDNRGFIGSDGLLGLSNDRISMVSQTASRFGRYFSYCLPSSSTSKGFLTFGNSTKRGSNSATLGFTPLVTVPQGPSFYGIKIIGISIGGTPLPVTSSKILMNSSAIIDSGTVISRLPPTVYHALRSAVRKSLANYTKAPAVSLFDTCYDFSKVRTIPDPKIVISFSGGVSVDLDTSGIFFTGDSQSQVCLAFAPNSADSDLVIYGNTQQSTFEIIYDVAGGKLGFSPNRCS